MAKSVAPGITLAELLSLDSSVLATLYVRWGVARPADYCSHNFITGADEAGLSVNRLLEDEDGFGKGREFWILQQLLDYQFLATMRGTFLPCYLVTGDEVGIGGDGEPLLTNVRYVYRFAQPRAAERRKKALEDAALDAAHQRGLHRAPCSACPACRAAIPDQLRADHEAGRHDPSPFTNTVNGELVTTYYSRTRADCPLCS